MTVATGPGWSLTNADCIAGMRLLDDASIDVTITDPPYEAEAHTKQRRIKIKGGGGDFGIADTQALSFPPITEEQRHDVAKQIGRVTRHWAIVFCQVEAVSSWRDSLLEGGMIYRRAIPWVKPDAMPALHGRWPGQAFETIVLASRKGARPCPGGGKSVFYSYMRHDVLAGAKKAPHPTTKPVELMRDLVRLVSNENDIVLDPFAGSGSTGIAALSLGRAFVGYELDATYFDIACRRLRGEEAKPRREQPGLFDAIGATL